VGGGNLKKYLNSVWSRFTCNFSSPIYSKDNRWWFEVRVGGGS